MAFVFGNISSSLNVNKVSEVKPIDPVVENFIRDGEPYYIILTDGRPNKIELDRLRKDLYNAEIKSYIIISAVSVSFDRENLKGVLNFVLANRSNWRDYITYNGRHCSGILTLGFALYSVTGATDIMCGDFYAADFMRPYFYLGHGYCGDYDTHIVPADSIADIYPVKGLRDPSRYVNWRTRFFYAQLRVLKQQNKWVPDLTPVKKIVISSKEDADKLLKETMNSTAVAYDTETTGLDVMEDRVICLTITWDGVTGYYIPWDLINKRLLVMNIESCKTRITQNGKFDCKIMWSNGLPFGSVEPTDDTGQLAHALHSDRPHGLKPLAYYHTYFGGYDLELDKFRAQTKVTNYGEIPHDILASYAIIDAIATYRSFFAMQELMREIDKKIPNEKMPDWTIERWYREVMMPVYPDFIEMEYRGFYVDREAQAKGQEELYRQQKELASKMASYWSVPDTFPFGNANRLGKLFQDLGWPCVEQGKSGIYSTSDSCLIEWRRQGKKGMDELMAYRTNAVFLQTFMGTSMEPNNKKGWNAFIKKDKDGFFKIHCDFKVNGTTSYRNIGTSPNLQQIPVRDTNAKLIQKVITVPPLEEITIETDNGRIYKGIATDKLKTAEGIMMFKDVKEDTEVLDYA